MIELTVIACTLGVIVGMIMLGSMQQTIHEKRIKHLEKKDDEDRERYETLLRTLEKMSVIVCDLTVATHNIKHKLDKVTISRSYSPLGHDLD